MRTSTTIRLLLSLLAGALLLPGAAPAASCANHAVRAEQGVQDGSAHSLPACRAYELASPPAKNEQEVNYPDRFVREVSFQAAELGGAVQYTLTGAIPGSESGGLYAAALSRSSAPASTWEVLPLEPNNYFESLHAKGQVAGEFERFSPQLNCGVEETRLALPAFNESEQPQLAPGEAFGEEVENLYEWNVPGEYTLVTNIRPTNPDATPEKAAYWVDGASSDCTKILFSSDATGYSVPGAPESSMYEWDAPESPAACRDSRATDPEACQPRVASVLPDGKDAATVVDPESGETLSTLNELSSDGSRLFFSAASDGGEPNETADSGAVQIYLRENGETKRAISLSQTEKPVRDTGAKFEAASSDGEKVFFVANYGLTGTDTPTEPKACIQENAGAGTGCDLYEYDVSSGTLTDISSDVKDPNGAEVRGVVGIAEDGSTVYFSSTGQLIEGKGNSTAQDEATTGENYRGAQKTEGEANVYGYYGGALHYIATIGQVEAGGTFSGSNIKEETDAISGNKGMHYYAARVSQDGRYLMLATRYPLTKYDNTQSEGGAPEWEDYEYSAESGALECASCNPTGEAPVTDTNEPFAALGVYLAVQDGVIPRNLSNDGRVFFDSTQPLESTAGGTSFAAQNRTVNVYEWRPEGLEGCVSPAAPSGAPVLHGCLGLIDSGAESERFPTYFEGASADGADAYITTHAALAPQDRDGLNDIYDVRIGGGIPAPPAPASCSEDLPSCQPPGAPFGTNSYGSESTLGGGNPPSSGPPQPKPIISTPTQGVKAFAKRKVKGTSITISVTAAASGRITGAGGGFKTVKMAVHRPGVYKLKVSLSAHERKLLKRKHRVSLKLKVSFAPASGQGSAMTLSITFT